MEEMRECEQKSLVNELTQGRELARQLQAYYLTIPSSSSNGTPKFLVQQIQASYEKAFSKLNYNNNNIILFTSPEVDPDRGFNEQDDQLKLDGSMKRLRVISCRRRPPHHFSFRQLSNSVDGARSVSKFMGYYRCAHRNSQGCLATKLVQRSNDDPITFHITYRGRHNLSCNTLLPTAPSENQARGTNAGDQGKLPVLILSLEGSELKRRPAIVFLRSSGMNKESVRQFLEPYASREYVAVAIDSRYHSEPQALVSSWINGDTMPFIFDTDLIKLADYLTQRTDIYPTRIGITGVSFGGMHARFAAFADTRYAVAAPIIGVQGFQWAIENDKWQARVDSIKPVFEDDVLSIHLAKIDLGKSAIDKEVVDKVWDRIAPDLASKFDSPYSIPAIAPRPLLILNGTTLSETLKTCVGYAYIVERISFLGFVDDQVPMIHVARSVV
ncbi:hypothetical protein F3Y22_tig00110156pilonHSYRG00598 [Hibiscus syriacus]|uniref:WRKY domain-containing protein n=1 Tax=Hibiscus syriacus TaxID=106335 RepID=A0A6A3BMF5_HIBSY|nr:hypothetical protein F3Y22_tig00110156pilonHSYRG00598 [Hibiscus syriacus]